MSNASLKSLPITCTSKSGTISSNLLIRSFFETLFVVLALSHGPSEVSIISASRTPRAFKNCIHCFPVMIGGPCIISSRERKNIAGASSVFVLTFGASFVFFPTVPVICGAHSRSFSITFGAFLMTSFPTPPAA